jgi:hypothetical protein
LRFKEGEMGKAHWTRRTPEEWMELVKRQKESGLSQAAYCRRKGVTLTSLEKWKSRYLLTPGFVDLTLKATESAWTMELELPHGVVLRIRG